MIQGSEEWFAARLGKVTASRIADVFASTKSGWGAGRINYEAELIAERLTGQATEGFTNATMQRGSDTEASAASAYEFLRDVEIEQVGFVDHPAIEMSGASPDGLIGTDGLVEIKCPNTATHIATILGKSIPGKYANQMAWQLACTGRLWCDFVSFDPRMPARHQLCVTRVERDNAKITELEDGVRAFIAEMTEKLRRLESPT